MHQITNFSYKKLHFKSFTKKKVICFVRFQIWHFTQISSWLHLELWSDLMDQITMAGNAFSVGPLKTNICKSDSIHPKIATKFKHKKFIFWKWIISKTTDRCLKKFSFFMVFKSKIGIIHQFWPSVWDFGPLIFRCIPSKLHIDLSLY